MNIEIIALMLSSGVVSLLVTVLVILLFIGKYREKVDRHDKDNEKLHQQFLEISNRLSRLEGIVDSNNTINKYVQSKSPLGLTEKGKALLMDSGGKDYIDSVYASFLQEIVKQKPKTAYDVQELSKIALEARVNKDEFIPIKEFCFEKGLNVKTVIDVLGIYLRDKLLPDIADRIPKLR